MKDDMHDLLRTWQPEIPEPAAFRRNVWNRIEGAERKQGVFACFLTMIARPKPAFAVVTAAVILGGIAGLGWSDDAGADAYLRSVNPYAQMR